MLRRLAQPCSGLCEPRENIADNGVRRIAMARWTSAA
jgi:hypothetical protein